MPDLWDIIAVIGIALVTAGIALIYIPAAFIVSGLLLVAIAWRFTPKQSGS